MIYAGTFPWSLYAGERQAILSKSLGDLRIPEIARAHYLDTLQQVPHPEKESPIDYRMRELFYLNIKWFMVNLLTRKDRMSMSNSLEVRVPFADKRLVQYAFNLPQQIKFADGREKGLLRKALRGILPEEICNRKKALTPKPTILSTPTLSAPRWTGSCATKMRLFCSLLMPQRCEKLSTAEVPPTKRRGSGS